MLVSPKMDIFHFFTKSINFLLNLFNNNIFIHSKFKKNTHLSHSYILKSEKKIWGVFFLGICDFFTNPEKSPFIFKKSKNQ